MRAGLLLRVPGYGDVVLTAGGDFGHVLAEANATRLVALVAVGEDVLLSQATVLAVAIDAVGDLGFFAQPHEVLARDVEKLGCFAGADLVLGGGAGDLLAVGEFLEGIAIFGTRFGREGGLAYGQLGHGSRLLATAA